MTFTEEQGSELIHFAKDSINSRFSDKDLIVSDDIKSRYSMDRGVFVTLNIDGALRGCIGYPEPIMPLYKAILSAARSAAFEDPRFPPLKREEFESVSIEISVLSVPELIKVKDADEYLKQIQIGDDGLIIRSKYTSGLLLPQVFTEYNCDAKTALEMLCKKAGLSKDDWRDPQNKIYKFQAQIFHQ